MGRMLEVARGVHGLRIVMVNVFLIETRQDGPRPRWILVDAGLSIGAGAIRSLAARRFGPDAPPEAIVLTHGHFDHVGSLAALAEEWDVPVYAHPLELPYVTGRSAYPPPDPVAGGGAMAWLSPLYPRGPIDVSSRALPLPDDGGVPGAPEWRWVHTPGHSPGHVSLFRSTDRTLIAGDAVITVKQESAFAVMTQAPAVHAPPAYYTTDWDRARASVRRLAGLRPDTLATGHGRVMRGDAMRQQLETLARTFDNEIPRFGRYANEPARADESGVISVPPAVIGGRTLLLAGAATAAVVITARQLARTRRRETTEDYVSY
jgi:glyoxylase-like metal-dependent hydrolase (beta-lactamase superfamily II)